jgi:hypothetical protein
MYLIYKSNNDILCDIIDKETNNSSTTVIDVGNSNISYGYNINADIINNVLYNSYREAEEILKIDRKKLKNLYNSNQLVLGI